MSVQLGSEFGFLREKITGIHDGAYFYTGAEGPPTVGQHESIARYLDDKIDGEAGRERSEQELSQLRAYVAELVQGTAAAVAVLSNTSEALFRLVNSMEFSAGDNVVTTDLEFPSGVYSLLTLRDQGVEVRIIPSRDGAVDTSDFAAAMDSRTRLVIASHVSYRSGAQIDAPEVYSLAQANGATFILDVTQSLGVASVSESYADALVCSTYKWLLGPHGLGLLYLSHPEKFAAKISGAGWRSVSDLFTEDRFERIHLHADARRFELGFPSFPSIYLLNNSLSALASVDKSEFEQHAAGLATRLIEGLAVQGFDLLTPLDPAKRATNISVTLADGEARAKRLLEGGINAWGGDGRVRFSVHGFNTQAEVDAALDAMARN